MEWAASLSHLTVTPAKFYLNTLRSEVASKPSERRHASEIGFYIVYATNTVPNINFLKEDHLQLMNSL